MADIRIENKQKHVDLSIETTELNAGLIKRTVENAISKGTISKPELNFISKELGGVDKLKQILGELDVSSDTALLIAKIDEVDFSVSHEVVSDLLSHVSEDLGLEKPIGGLEKFKKILESITEKPELELISTKMEELETLTKASSKDLSAMKEKIKELSDEIKKVSEPGMIKEIEKEIGGNLIEIFSGESLTKKEKMDLFKEIAKNSFTLHNCAVGYLEQSSSVTCSSTLKEVLATKEAKYKTNLISMAKESISTKMPSADTSMQGKFIEKNSLLAKCLASSAQIDPKAELHPGAWGLFLLQPNTSEELDSIKKGYSADLEVLKDPDASITERAERAEGDSCISKLPPLEDGFHLYTTNGNNRRSFQRAIDGESIVTFSTKGNGLDLSVPKELLDIASTLQRPFQESLDRLNTGKLTIFNYVPNESEGHQTVGFADPSIKDDFGYIQDKQKILADLSATSEVFSPLKKAFPQSLFVVSIAKTATNEDKIPAAVKGQTITQMVTMAEGETSLRLMRSRGNDTYRLGYSLEKQLEVSKTELTALEGSRENRVKLEAELSGPPPERLGGDLKKIENWKKFVKDKIGELPDPPTELQLQTLRTKVDDLQKKVDALNKLEVAEFQKVTKSEITELKKIPEFTRDESRLITRGDEASKELQKTALCMSYNLIGSLALFIKDGDSSGAGGAGDSFDARNISNGSVRDEDEWGEGLIRKSGSAFVSHASNDLSGTIESLNDIIRTLRLPDNQDMAAIRSEIRTAQTVLTNFRDNFFGTSGSFQFSGQVKLDTKISTLLDDVSLSAKKSEIQTAILASPELKKHNITDFNVALGFLRAPSDETIEKANDILDVMYRTIAKEYLSEKMPLETFKKMFSSL